MPTRQIKFDHQNRIINAEVYYSRDLPEIILITPVPDGLEFEEGFIVTRVNNKWTSNEPHLRRFSITMKNLTECLNEIFEVHSDNSFSPKE
jgi:hypothetical protein